MCRNAAVRRRHHWPSQTSTGTRAPNRTSVAGSVDDPCASTHRNTSTFAATSA